MVSDTQRRRPARRGEGSQLRDEIVAAAGREIARSGDAGSLTLRGVAREVGVAATSIYLHFDTVTDLVEEVKRCRFTELQEVLTSAAEAAGDDPVARVRARGQAYVRYGREHPGEYAVMFTSRLSTGAVRLPFTLAALHDLEADLRAHLQEHGPGPASDVAGEAHLIATHLWTSLHGSVTLRLLRPHMEWPDEEAEVDDLVDRLLGLRA